MTSLLKALFIFQGCRISLANPYMVLYPSNERAPMPTPPAAIDTVEEYPDWFPQLSNQLVSGMDSYHLDHFADLEYAQSAVNEVAAAATLKLPTYVTATAGRDLSVISQVPARFTELPDDMQRIKSADGEVVEWKIRAVQNSLTASELSDYRTMIGDNVSITNFVVGTLTVTGVVSTQTMDDPTHFSSDFGIGTSSSGLIAPTTTTTTTGTVRESGSAVKETSSAVLGVLAGVVAAAMLLYSPPPFTSIGI